MTTTTRPATKIRARIQAVEQLLARPGTPGEQAAARNRLDALRASLARLDAEPAAADDGGLYRLPGIAYGAKRTGYMSLYEIADAIKAEIRLSRRLGKTPAKPGELKYSDPIADAPAGLRITVSRRYIGSGCGQITVRLTGVPTGPDWWVTRTHPDVPGYIWRACGPRLAALRDALAELMWAYNYDGSDPQVDYSNRGFYEKILADGHGEGGHKDLLGSAMDWEG